MKRKTKKQTKAERMSETLGDLIALHNASYRFIPTIVAEDADDVPPKFAHVAYLVLVNHHDSIDLVKSRISVAGRYWHAYALRRAFGRMPKSRRGWEERFEALMALLESES